MRTVCLGFCEGQLKGWGTGIHCASRLAGVGLCSAESGNRVQRVSSAGFQGQRGTLGLSSFLMEATQNKMALGSC